MLPYAKNCIVSCFYEVVSVADYYKRCYPVSHAILYDVVDAFNSLSPHAVLYDVVDALNSLSTHAVLYDVVDALNSLSTHAVLYDVVDALNSLSTTITTTSR